ncbi:MAG: substrate-binding domain-containing protein [Polyangiaceae bacterium]|nr:substrate-binding domain-containing protein [Polyangiaceae bacterium]
MKLRILLVVVSCMLSVALGLLVRERAEGEPGKRSQNGVLVGLSLDTLKEARWQVDRRLFVEKVNRLGGRVLDLSANSDDTTQISDVEKLITQKVDVMVIVPHDGKAMAKAVRMAHAAGIPVIAYDRLIRDAPLDLYLSFDNERVGELQAQYLVSHLKTPGKGKIVRIYGSKSDNNAFMFKAGQDRVLKPLIERGDISVVHEDWADDWKPENAKRIMNAAISAHGRDFEGVLASNDGTAGGAILALTEEGILEGKLVTGQDADLVACQRIARGTQTMTVYKPLQRLAESAAEVAMKLARREVVVARSVVNNGERDVPSVLSDVVAVDRGNLRETVILDKFQPEAEVFRGISPPSPSPSANPSASPSPNANRVPNPIPNPTPSAAVTK